MTVTAQDRAIRCDRCGAPVGRGAGDPPAAYRFCGFELHAETGELRRGGKTIPIEPLARKFLCLLIEHAQHLVTRTQAEEALWPKHHQGDAYKSLNCLVKKVRRCLGESGADPKLLRTISHSGWMFTKPVAVVPFGRPSPSNGASATPCMDTADGIWIIAVVVAPSVPDKETAARFASCLKAALDEAGLGQCRLLGRRRMDERRVQ